MRSSGPEIVPFYAGEINRRAAALARAGRSIIPMHLGQPTRGPSDATVAAANRALVVGPNGYWESHELKERLVEHYREWYSVEVDPELHRADERRERRARCGFRSDVRNR